MPTRSCFQKGPALEGGPSKKKRRVMKDFVLTEISAVDYAAQEPARAVLMKRRETPEHDQMFEKLMLMTSEEDGHQHGVTLDHYDIENMGGSTNYAGSDSGESQHSHTYTVSSDGTITVGVNAGHTHEINSQFLRDLMTQRAMHEMVEKRGNSVEPLIKKEIGKKFTASDFALVGNPNEPETWKHRLVRTPNGKPDRRLVGNAVSALKRGEVPKDKQMTVIRRVRAAWQHCYRSSSTQMPSVLKRIVV